MPAQEELRKEIIDQGFCTACGACVGLCPYIVSYRSRIRVIHPCGMEEGSCYRLCPRAGFNVRDLDLAVLGREREDQALGVTQGIYFARARQKAPRAQYGGAATALMALALAQGLVGGAVLAGGEVNNPKGILAKTPAEVYAAAGSKYTAVPTLEQFNQALAQGLTLGFTGRPCQVTAVRRGQAASSEPPGRQYPPGGVGLLVGLFCFWSLGPEFYTYLADITGGEEILRMDIPVDGPRVVTPTRTLALELDRIRPFINQPCLSCLDATAEWSDLAVGSTEYDEAWNTLVVRTRTGKQLFDLALEKGVLEVREYPPERLPLLRQAVLNKKARILGRDSNRGPVVPDGYRVSIMEEWRGTGYDPAGSLSGPRGDQGGLNR